MKWELMLIRKSTDGYGRLKAVSQINANGKPIGVFQNLDGKIFEVILRTSPVQIHTLDPERLLLNQIEDIVISVYADAASED